MPTVERGQRNDNINDIRIGSICCCNCRSDFLAVEDVIMKRVLSVITFVIGLVSITIKLIIKHPSLLDDSPSQM